MDDTCTLLSSNSINEFHDHLDPNIQFTLEKENDVSLPFLDVLLSKDSDGSIRTSVFRKPTHTDKYLFSSHHPLNHKMSVVKTLFNRASLLSTSLVEQSIEESHIVQALKGNGYPTRFIHRSQVVSACQKSNVYSEVSPKTVNIPYIQGLSESIRRVLSELDIVVHFIHFVTFWLNLRIHYHQI